LCEEKSLEIEIEMMEYIDDQNKLERTILSQVLILCDSDSDCNEGILLQEWSSTENQVIEVSESEDIRSDACNYLDDQYIALEGLRYEYEVREAFSSWLSDLIDESEESVETK